MQVRHLAAVLVATISCHAAGPVRPRVPPERAQIAEAEARRAAGVPTLIALAKHADPAVRAAALRGLGRTGGADAIAALREVLRHGTRDDATAAAAALGVAAATGAPGIEERDTGEVSAELVAALDHARRDVVLEAIGRAGDASALPALIAALDSPDAEQAALALARFGRRGLPIGDAARAALVRATASPASELRHTAIRYAAVYALGREVGAPDDDPAAPALRARLLDDVGEIRAVAASALARRKQVVQAESALVDRLGDADWRVAVEAVRALAGDAGTDRGRDAVAVFVVRQWTRLAAQQAHPPAAHAVLEGLRLLAGHADREPVRAALASIADAPVAAGPDALALGWAQCLARAALAQSGGAPLDRLVGCGGPALPAFERDVLAAGVLAAGGGGSPDQRWAQLAPRIAAPDARVAAAAIAAAPKVWAGLAPDARAQAVAAAGVRIARGDDAVAEAAADAIAAYLADPADTGPTRDVVTAWLVERAKAPGANPEVAITIFGDLATAKLTAAADVCDAARRDPDDAVAAAARACVKALRGDDPGPAAPRAAPARPRVEPAALLGHDVIWTVETTRGTFSIALEPDLAPWHVAAIVALTRAHVYDGLSWHRVVPDFVVQGGDPTGTGAGGPGYTLPAEPDSLLDALASRRHAEAGYQTGAVGIADAGKDTGGSQWFVMHDRAPHLDGRYTRIGRLTGGQDVVDALQIDDRILRATVDVR